MMMVDDTSHASIFVQGSLLCITTYKDTRLYVSIKRLNKVNQLVLTVQEIWE